MNEIFDVVDDADRVIGQASRAEVHATGLKHRAVHIFLFNHRGELFIQQRAATKDTFPGRYDSSASGHLGAGEDYDACAERELKEELGLAIPRRHLRRLFKIAAGEQTGWEFVWTYSVHGDYQPQINHDEIESGEFLTRDQVEALVPVAPAFRRIVHEFRARGLFPSSR